MNFRTTFAKSGGGHVHPVATPLFVTEEGAGRVVNWAALNAGLRRLQSGASDFTGPLVVTVNKEKVSNSTRPSATLFGFSSYKFRTKYSECPRAIDILPWRVQKSYTGNDCKKWNSGPYIATAHDCDNLA